MLLLERNRRSSLYLLADGDVEREYHDTGQRAPVPVHVDDSGVARIGSNRSVDALAEAVLSRAAPDRRHDGVGAPLHIIRAHIHLCDGVRDVDALARRCRVATSTAWNYACRVLEWFPDANVHAATLVYPPLLDAMTRVDTTGSLRDVMRRVNAGPLFGDMQWREVSDRYAHLRLARLCVMR
jgi:hypothetical protein